MSSRAPTSRKTRYDVQVLVDEHGGQVADDQTETDKSGEPLRARWCCGCRRLVRGRDERARRPRRRSLDEHADVRGRDHRGHRRRGPGQGRRAASVERVRAAARPGPDDPRHHGHRVRARPAPGRAGLAARRSRPTSKDQTSLATVKVNIERRPEPKAPITEDDDAGFLAGLAAGWDGLTTPVVAVATVVGAVLPFAVVCRWSASRSGCCVAARVAATSAHAWRARRRSAGSSARLHEAG